MRNKVLHPLTEKINQKQKNKAKQARQEALEWLAATFPKTFDTSIAIHPLKIGIMQDLLQHVKQDPSCKISTSKLREAIVIFTRSIEYLTCMKAREIRIDLYGNPTVPVTEEEAAQAILKIKKHIEKNSQYHRKNAAVLGNSNAAPNEKSLQQSYTQREKLLEDSPAKSPTRISTVVKHKVSRKYDVNTVSRLKEKLGLMPGAIPMEP